MLNLAILHVWNILFDVKGQVHDFFKSTNVLKVLNPVYKLQLTSAIKIP